MGCAASKHTAAEVSPSKPFDNEINMHCDEIRELMRQLRQMQQFDSEEAFKTICKIYKKYFGISGTANAQSKIGHVLVKENYLEIFAKLWDKCHEDVDLFYRDVSTWEFKNLRLMKYILANYSRRSEELAFECYKNATTIECILKEFSMPQLALSEFTKKGRLTIVKANLSALKRLLENENRNREHVWKHACIERILPYTKATDSTVKVNALAVIAHCVDKRDDLKTISRDASSPAIIKNEESSPQPMKAGYWDIVMQRFCEFAREQMVALTKMELFSDKQAIQHLENIGMIYFGVSETHREVLSEVSKVLLDGNILDIFTRLWDKCHESPDEFYGDVTSTQFTNLRKLKSILQNFANLTSEFAVKFYQNEVAIQRILQEFSMPQLTASKLEDDEFRSLINVNLGILHNCLRYESRNRNHIRRNGGIEKILAYASSSFSIIKAVALIVLAYCINEDENSTIVAGSGVVGFIVKILESKITTTKYVDTEGTNFSVEETVHALTKLASNEENKKAIVAEGVLPLLAEVIKDEKASDLEYLRCINCLWSLAFNKGNKTKIIKEPGLIDRVKKLRKVDGASNELIKSIESLMFILDLAQPIEIHGNGGQKHIMLSYNWEVQPAMLKLKSYLVSQGIPIWMDVDKIHGSILDAMSEAVENSSLIVIAMTESYKNSLPCRTEAHYAYSRNVPVLPLLLQPGYKADGWLGVLLGMELYVDLSAGDLDQRFPDVLKEINSRTTQLARKNTQVDGPVSNVCVESLPMKEFDGQRVEPAAGNTQDLKRIREILEEILALKKEDNSLKSQQRKLKIRFLKLQIEKLEKP